MSIEIDRLVGEPGLAGLKASLQGGEPFVVHGDPLRLPDWMRHETLASIEAFCAHYSGRILHGRLDRGPRSTLVERGSAADLFASGEALYLPDVDEKFSNSKDWIRNLEIELNIPRGSARATAWLAPADEGTALHFDAEDVLSIQLLGTKVFDVAEPAALRYPTGFQYGPGIPAAADLYPQAADGFPDPAGAHFTSVELRPGSVLVLPRGHWHRTRCITASLSLSVILSPPTGLDWMLARLRHRALESAVWRQPLYGAPDVVEAERLTRAMAGVLASLDAGDDAAAAATLQRIPTVTLEGGPDWVRRDHYDGRSEPVTPPALALTVLAGVAAGSAAFTVADARARHGEGVDAALEWLEGAGLLYRWPYPRQRH